MPRLLSCKEVGHLIRSDGWKLTGALLSSVLLTLGVLMQLGALNLFDAPSAHAQTRSEFSVKISMAPERAFPGETVTISVQMSTQKQDARGTLDVQLGEDLMVIGAPYCTGDCTQAGLLDSDSNAVMAIFDVGGYAPRSGGFATLTFTATVSPDIKPGTTIPIRASMGFPSAIDQAFLQINSFPTPIPATLSLGVAPDGFIVGPDGSFIVYAYPFIPFTQGAMTEQRETMPEMIVKASVPKGLALKDDSSCFHQGSSAPNLQPLCAIEQTPDHVSIEIPEQEQSTGILLHFENTRLDTGSLYNMTFTLELPKQSLPVNTPTTSVDIIAIESLSILGAEVDDGSMGVLVMSSRAGCTQPYMPQSGSVSLAEWGGGPIVSTSTTQPLINADAIAPFDSHCPTLIGFKDVKPLTLYIVGSTPAAGMGDVFCRACVLGTVPWSNDAMPIIKTWYDH